MFPYPITAAQARCRRLEPLPPNLLGPVLGVVGRGKNWWRSTEKERELQKAEAMLHLIRLCPRAVGGSECQALPWEPGVNRGQLMPWARVAPRPCSLRHRAGRQHILPHHWAGCSPAREGLPWPWPSVSTRHMLPLL